MMRPSFGFSALLSLTVLLTSIGIDIHAMLAASPVVALATPVTPGFTPIGPRRYPPAYHAGHNQG